MKPNNAKYLIAQGLVLALVFSGCAGSGPRAEVKPIDKPSAAVQGTDKKLYLSALKAQNAGQFEPAIKLWKEYLAKNPNSYEGHNNLGMVYYTQDRVTQALQEFEIAHRLEPLDPKVRENLARALRFRADMFHENREYFKTLKILARLEKIVTPREVEGVLITMEQVEDQIFLQVIKSNDASAYLDFVDRFPDGLNAVRALEYMDKHPKQVTRAKSLKKNRKLRKPRVNKSQSSGSFSSGSTSQAPPDYGVASTYGSSKSSASYSPPSKSGKAKKKKRDIFGVDPTATESITEENVTASQEPTVLPVIIPSENFTKSERVEGKSDASGTDKTRLGKDSPSRTQPEVLADKPDTHPDLEASPVVVAVVPSSGIKLEQTGQENPPMATAEAAETKMAEQEKPQAPPVESPTQALAPSAIEQAIKEAEAELAQAQSKSAGSSSEAIMATESAAALPAVEKKAEPKTPEEPPMEVAKVDPETEIPEPAPAESKTLDPDALAKTMASMVPAPKPVAAQKTSANTVVVIKVRQGSTLNVRAKPASSGEVLGFLENGDMMPYVKESGGWYQIKIDEGIFGWVSSKFSVTQVMDAGTPMVFPEAGEEEMAKAETPASVDSPATGGSMVKITVREGRTLNVRSQPSPQGKVVDALKSGETRPLVKESGDWYQLRLEDGTAGWVSSKFSRIQTAASDAPESSAKAGNDSKQAGAPVTTVVVIQVKKGSSLTVRSAPSSQGQVLGRLKNGEMRPLLEESGEWYQVEYQDGQSGWVSSKFSAKQNQ